MKFWDTQITIVMPEIEKATTDNVRVGSKVWVKWSEKAKIQESKFRNKWGTVKEVYHSKEQAIVVEFDHGKHWFYDDGSFGTSRGFAQLYLEKC